MKIKKVDKKYLEKLGVDLLKITEQVLKQVISVTNQYDGLDIDEHKLVSAFDYLDEDYQFPKHANTPTCPQNIRECIPAKGCEVNCRYCLVVGLEGFQTDNIIYYKNYPDIFYKLIQKNIPESHELGGLMYYFSPKTEVFTDEIIRNGITGAVLINFKKHIDKCIAKYGFCNDTLFIVTKGGYEELVMKDSSGGTMLELLIDIADNVQVSTSIAPLDKDEKLRKILEPNGASKKSRLKLVKTLQENNVFCSGLLAEPVFTPFLPDKIFFQEMYDSGIRRIALDILTTTYKNLAIVAQLIGSIYPQKEKQMWEEYLFSDSPPKSNNRVSVSINLQEEYYKKMIADANAVGINLMTYCRYVCSITNLPQLNYMDPGIEGEKGVGGCMAYINPSLPKYISKLRVAQPFSIK